MKKPVARAGIVAYYLEDQNILIRLMIPSNSDFGGIKPQVAKGRVEEGEHIQETAVREGEEELGLKRSNFAESVVSIGEFPIIGQEEKYIFHCFAVRVKNLEDFNTPHFETGWSGWMPCEQALSRIKNGQKELLLATINKIKQLHF